MGSVTVISFSASVLEEMHRALPEIPTASLSGFAQNEFEKDSKFYNAINAVADITQGNLKDYVYYENTLKDRGYMSFCWTLGTAQDCRAISANGEFGLTNNVADAYGESVCKIEGKAGQTMLAKKIKKGGDIKIITTAYNGEQTEEKGKIFAVRKFEDYAEVIALYEEVEKVKEPKKKTGKKVISLPEEELHKIRKRRHNPLKVALGTIGGAAVAMIIATIIIGQVRITELNQQIITAKETLSNAQSVYTQTEMSLQAKLSSSDIEKYAENQLGLTKASSSQQEFVSLSGGDKAEVTSPESENLFTQFISSIANLWS